MDKKRTKKANYRRLAGWIIGLAVVLGSGYVALQQAYTSTTAVAKNRLTISAVERSPFYEYINVTGTVAPRTTYFIDSKVAGTVEEVLVEAGEQVRPGDTLLHLANADLQLEVMQRESQLIEQLNNQRQTALLLNQNNFNQRAQLVEIGYQIGLQQKQYQRNQQLLADSVISQSDYEPIADRYHYLLQRQKLLEQSYRSDSLARVIQLQQINDSEARILDNLRAVRRILDRLHITTLATGQLSDFSVQTGQAVSSGERIGEVYSMTNPQVTAQIDEYYLDKVSVGQNGIALFKGDTLQLRVEKIFPTVEEGRFRVEMGFADPAADSVELIKGQSFRVRLFFGEPTETVLLANGNFYSSTGGHWVYLVQGEQAVKRYVELGRKNPRYYEVLDGLLPGDRVITSTYDNFKNYETIKFN